MEEKLKILLLIRAKYEECKEMHDKYQHEAAELLFRSYNGEQLTKSEKSDLEMYNILTTKYDGGCKALKNLFFDIAVDEDHRHVDYYLKKVEMDETEWEEYVDAFIKKNQ